MPEYARTRPAMPRHRSHPTPLGRAAGAVLTVLLVAAVVYLIGLAAVVAGVSLLNVGGASC